MFVKLKRKANDTTAGKLLATHLHSQRYNGVELGRKRKKINERNYNEKHKSIRL